MRGEDGVEIAAGGVADDSVGFFVRPTVVLADDPDHEVFTTEYFGPILGVFVYDDADYDTVLCESAAVGPYGLTGSIIAQDRAAIAEAMDVLRFAAGNFYINDKPTGAVVGQQPFGGARGSGTNDKAGSILNLQRWVSPRTIRSLSCRQPITATPTWIDPDACLALMPPTRRLFRGCTPTPAFGGCVPMRGPRWPTSRNGWPTP